MENPKMSPSKLEFFINWHEELEELIPRRDKINWPMEIDLYDLCGECSEYPQGECSIYLEKWELVHIRQAVGFFEDSNEINQLYDH